ncbi:sigma-70 family RNA polymerase sigma factor [Salininema proteolyticum]|uniref:Sigma-70 family RNA polymerase sigma factor n=1 Tax=Salininema proteolyticum TaxID=1607685 RepID=A0ABV8U5Q8_9ACTN
MEDLVRRFEAQRPRLQALACRILRSDSDAEDVVQDAWLRLASHAEDRFDNLEGWLTTVTTRLCLTRLERRRARPEVPLGTAADGETAVPDPVGEAVLGETVAGAMSIVLEALRPAERVAFVLHDMFAIPFGDIARTLDRSEQATRQLASRARRRVRDEVHPDTDLRRERRVVEAFLSAARDGRMRDLLGMLDPDALMRADEAAVAAGAAPESRGADDIAALFSGRARAAFCAVVGDRIGIAWLRRGEVGAVIEVRFAGGLIRDLSVVAHPGRLRRLRVSLPVGS